MKMKASPKKLPDDLLTLDVEWRIVLAKQGDGELLAELLRSERRRNEVLQFEPTSELLWSFLTDVITGEIKLPAPRKLTYLAKTRRWQREKAVARGLDIYMGKRRNKSERTLWMRKLCAAYGTTPNAVAAFQQSSRKRRS
jgi:hypothetical protein